MKRRLSVLSAAGLATMAMTGAANADLLLSDDFTYDHFANFVGAFGRGQGFTGGYGDAWAPGTGWGAYSNAGIAGRAQDGTDKDNAVLSGTSGGGGAGSGTLARTWAPGVVAGADTLWFGFNARGNHRTRFVIDSNGFSVQGNGEVPDADDAIAIGFAPGVAGGAGEPWTGGGILAQLGPVNSEEERATNEMVWDIDDLGYNTLWEQITGDQENTGPEGVTIVGKLEFNVDGGVNERWTLEVLDENGLTVATPLLFENDTGLDDAGGLGDQITMDIIADGGSQRGRIHWMAMGTSRDDVTNLVNSINPRLTLSVAGDGTATLENNSGVDLDIDGFSIASSTGALDGGALSGLSGGGWATNQAASDIIVQSNFTSSSVIANGGSVDLGQIFASLPDPSTISFEFSSAAGTQNVGLIEGLGGFILGDMNGDGSLDAFDVEPFELALADPEAYEAQYGIDPDVRGDMNGSGGLDAFDVEPFEGALAGGGSAAVPEPASLALVGLGLATLARRRRA